MKINRTIIIYNNILTIINYYIYKGNIFLLIIHHNLLDLFGPTYDLQIPSYNVKLNIFKEF